MDVAKNIDGNLSVPVSDPLLPHSPTQAHDHDHMNVSAVRTGTGHTVNSESDSVSSSGEGESDVSDMVVDNSSKFAALSKKRRKSGESDYVPREESRSPESQSESESESNSGQSEEEESDTSAESNGLPPRKLPTGSLVRRLSDESDHSSSSSSRLTPAPLQQHQRASPGMSPLIKRTSNSHSSPFTKTNTRNILNDVTMRRHNYQLCPPKRQAAMNVKYSFYSEDEDQEDEPIVRSSYKSRVNRKRRRSPSGSEYEASDPTSVESSGEDSFVVDDDESDDYRPRKRGAGGRGRRARVSNWHGGHVCAGINTRLPIIVGSSGGEIRHTLVLFSKHKCFRNSRESL